MKRILSVLTAIALCFALSTSTFAAEASQKEPQPTRMWASGTYTVPSYSSVNTGTFYVGDPYFAFEMSGQTSSGGTSSGTYTVELRRASGGLVASGTGYINKAIYKFDWISVNSGNYYFIIYNNSNTAIKVTLTYYSWT